MDSAVKIHEKLNMKKLNGALNRAVAIKKKFESVDHKPKLQLILAFVTRPSVPEYVRSTSRSYYVLLGVGSISNTQSPSWRFSLGLFICFWVTNLASRTRDQTRTERAQWVNPFLCASHEMSRIYCFFLFWSRRRRMVANTNGLNMSIAVLLNCFRGFFGTCHHTTVLFHIVYESKNRCGVARK